jgi:hypothetical protein
MIGRPSKYKEEYCKMLEEHMGTGLSFESFGGKIDVCEDTLFEWKKVHPDFSESYKRGRLKSMLHWEEMGHDMVLAGQGNATCWIFNMKNRFGWKDKTEQDLNVKGLQGLVGLETTNEKES